ncbi:DUF1214 domain-containing protein [Synechococcus sp. CS-1329]|nr:DUF1214 domain-containing protein [Synechococcus sp. CS-1329]
MTTKWDSRGCLFQADCTYRLTVAKDVPAGQLWALILYSENTRRPYDNGGAELRDVSIDSMLSGLDFNSNGSINLYVGTSGPAGCERNFLKTGRRGRVGFVCFRLYACTFMAILRQDFQPACSRHDQLRALVGHPMSRRWLSLCWQPSAVPEMAWVSGRLLGGGLGCGAWLGRWFRGRFGWVWAGFRLVDGAWLGRRFCGGIRGWPGVGAETGHHLVFATGGGRFARTQRQAPRFPLGIGHLAADAQAGAEHRHIARDRRLTATERGGAHPFGTETPCGPVVLAGPEAAPAGCLQTADLLQQFLLPGGGGFSRLRAGLLRRSTRGFNGLGGLVLGQGSGLAEASEGHQCQQDDTDSGGYARGAQ